MSRVDGDIVGQGEEFGPDAGDQGVVIPAGKVGPAHGSGKQGVSHKHSRSAIIQTDASRRVAGGMQYGQCDLSDGYLISIIEQSIRVR